MPLIVYLDEVGDHSLDTIDENFPVFGTVMFVCEVEAYISRIVPDWCRFKFDYFGHEGAILHSRDIRRAQRDFGFLTDPGKRPRFYNRISALMSKHEYRLIAIVIQKQRLKDRYRSNASHPYSLAMEFSLESRRQKEICIVAEARGKREDKELELSFLQLINSGTDYVAAERFRAIKFRLEFREKSRNMIGTQIADLAAYPIARHVIDPASENPAFEVIEKKIHGKLKIFP